MALIDVLWRQDIDMGVGKETFDVNLRRELEKEQELFLKKEEQKVVKLDICISYKPGKCNVWLCFAWRCLVYVCWDDNNPTCCTLLCVVNSRLRKKTETTTNLSWRTSCSRSTSSLMARPVNLGRYEYMMCRLQLRKRLAFYSTQKDVMISLSSQSWNTFMRLYIIVYYVCAPPTFLAIRLRV